MEIHLSFDYELFFGSNSGTVNKCMIEPTNRLLDLAKKAHIPLIFFVDAGFIFQLKNSINNQACKLDYEKVCMQLQRMIYEGHEIGLHVHPHWEDSFYHGDKWVINTKRYKLDDFSELEIKDIITKYHLAISEITGKPCRSYRAGGWCIQPFSKIKAAFKENNLVVDSSVFKNGYHNSKAHFYDFRNTPSKDQWLFEEDCCLEEINGSFLEVPNTNDRISPIFYWNLYARMKISPLIFKPLGDGMWLKDKAKVYSQFYKTTHHFACADGFFASRLINILKKQELKKSTKLMVLSHPKSMAECSFTFLDKFITFAIERNHTFNKLTYDA